MNKLEGHHQLQIKITKYKLQYFNDIFHPNQNTHTNRHMQDKNIKSTIKMDEN